MPLLKPTPVLYVPSEQLAHASAVAAPSAEEYLPAAHKGHGAVAPSVDAKLPATQRTHTVTPLDGPYVPPSHCVHSVEPIDALLYVPAGQRGPAAAAPPAVL